MKKLIVILSCLLVLVIGYLFSLEKVVKTSVSGLIGRASEEGYEIQYQEAYTGVSPFLMEWKFHDVNVRVGENGGNGFVAHLPDMNLSVDPLHPFTLGISSGGDFLVTHQENGKEFQYSGRLERFRSKVGVGLNNAVKILMAEAEINDIELRGDRVLPVTNRIEKLYFSVNESDGKSMLASPLMKASAIDGMLPLEIKKIQIEHGPLRLQGEGALILSASHAPALYVESEITGLYEAARLVEKNGYYDSRNMIEAHHVLDAYCLKGKDPRGPILDITLSFYDQAFYAGEMKIMEFDHLMNL